MHFGQIRVSDLILVNDRGEVVEGDRPVNTAAFAIHSRCTRRGPTSSPPPMPTPCTARPGRRSAGSDPITQDACAFYDDHALFDDYTGVVLDLEEGKRIARAR